MKELRWTITVVLLFLSLSAWVMNGGTLGVVVCLLVALVVKP